MTTRSRMARGMAVGAALALLAGGGCLADDEGTGKEVSGVESAVLLGPAYWFSGTRWSDWVTYKDMRELAGDFDGDGRTDVMKFDVPSSGSSSNGVWVGLSRTDPNGNDYYETTRWATWVTYKDMKVLSGDFDGDGRDDIMKFDVPSSGSSANGLWVGLSRTDASGASYFEGYRWGTWITYKDMQVFAGDFDGDGRDDVMKFDVPSSGSAAAGLWVGLSRTDAAGNRFFDTTQWATWITYKDMKVLTGDFDGDNRTDVMKFDIPSSGSSANGLWVGLSRSNAAGTRFFDGTQWATWITYKDMKVLAGDFDGDGRSDIMKFDIPSSGMSSNGLWVGLSRTVAGAPVFDGTEWARWVTYRDMKVLAGDFDGDLATDVMKFDVPSSGSSTNGLWAGLARSGASFTFNGIYGGTVFGSAGSSATATLTLTQTGANLGGSLAVGAGLVVDVGICGTQTVPASTFGPFAGAVLSPHLATGSFTQNVMGFDVTGTFTGELSADGSSMAVSLALDVPWPCADRTLTGTFTRR